MPLRAPPRKPPRTRGTWSPDIPHGSSYIPWSDLARAIVCPVLLILAGLFLTAIVVRLAYLAILTMVRDSGDEHENNQA